MRIEINHDSTHAWCHSPGETTDRIVTFYIVLSAIGLVFFILLLFSFLPMFGVAFSGWGGSAGLPSFFR